MAETRRDLYGDNYLDDYQEENHPSYWETERFMPQAQIDYSAVVYGAGLALVITLVCLVMGFLWAQAVESVALDYSFLVDLTLAASVMFGAFRGSMRAKNMGLAHGGLIGLAYSVVGILILAVLLPVNWMGALETIAIAVFLGGIGGVIGINYRQTRDSSTWRDSEKQKHESAPGTYQDDYNDFFHTL